jgi:phage/plasmid-associated DNA primase
MELSSFAPANAHHRNNRCFKQALVAFEPKAECPALKMFLDRIMAVNWHLIRFVQRTVGYFLTGMMTEYVLGSLGIVFGV